VCSQPDQTWGGWGEGGSTLDDRIHIEVVRTREDGGDFGRLGRGLASRQMDFSRERAGPQAQAMGGSLGTWGSGLVEWNSRVFQLGGRIQTRIFEICPSWPLNSFPEADDKLS
jgi:hypothetical protein